MARSITLRTQEGVYKGKIKGKYPDIIIKIKQLFFHKISGFILTEVTPLIIYGYANLSLVALYGNYLVIISGVKLAVSSVFDSIGASVGNLVAVKCYQ